MGLGLGGKNSSPNKLVWSGYYSCCWGHLSPPQRSLSTLFWVKGLDENSSISQVMGHLEMDMSPSVVGVLSCV